MYLTRHVLTIQYIALTITNSLLFIKKPVRCSYKNDIMVVII